MAGSVCCAYAASPKASRSTISPWISRPRHSRSRRPRPAMRSLGTSLASWPRAMMAWCCLRPDSRLRTRQALTRPSAFVRWAIDSDGNVTANYANTVMSATPWSAIPLANNGASRISLAALDDDGLTFLLFDKVGIFTAFVDVTAQTVAVRQITGLHPLLERTLLDGSGVHDWRWRRLLRHEERPGRGRQHAPFESLHSSKQHSAGHRDGHRPRCHAAPASVGSS